MGFNFNPSGDGTVTAFTTVQTPNGTYPVATGDDTLTLTSDGSITITGNSGTDTITFVANGTATTRAKPAADLTTTSASAGDATGLSFSVAANTTYSFEINLTTGCSGTGGVKFAITVPSGATFRASMHGLNTGSTTQRSDMLTVSGSLSGAYNALAANGGYVRAYGSVTTSSTAGTFQLRFASTSAGETSTIFKESFLQAWSY